MLEDRASAARTAGESGDRAAGARRLVVAIARAANITGDVHVPAEAKFQETPIVRNSAH